MEFEYDLPGLPVDFHNPAFGITLGRVDGEKDISIFKDLSVTTGQIALPNLLAVLIKNDGAPTLAHPQKGMLNRSAGQHGIDKNKEDRGDSECHVT